MQFIDFTLQTVLNPGGYLHLIQRDRGYRRPDLPGIKGKRLPVIIVGEEEILFSANAKYRILDVGLVKENLNTLDPLTGEIIKTEEIDSRTYVKLELL